jgi:intracellular multiplication protein IcmB
MASLIESLIETIYSFTKKSPIDYSDIETTVGKRTFVYKNQTMATVIAYSGIKRNTGKAETIAVADKLAQTLNPFFAQECHEAQFVLHRDLMTEQEMRRRMEPKYASAAAMGMSDVIDDILDEEAATMARICMDDTIVLVLYTHPKVMRPEDYKQWCAELLERRRKGEFYTPPGIQDDTYAIDPMVALHDSYVDQVVATLEDPDVGAACEVLDTERASGLIRRIIDPLGTSRQWHAWTNPETKEAILKRFGTRRNGEPMVEPSPLSLIKEKPDVTHLGKASFYYPPPLREQLIPQVADYKDGCIEYSGRLYSTITMVTAPKRDVTAQQLTSKFAGLTARHGNKSLRVPYRLSLRLRGCGLTQIQMRGMIAPLFAVGSHNNKKVYKAYEALQDERNNDLAMGTISLSITTWADVGDEDAVGLLKTRVVALRSAASQWGDMTVEEDVLDRMQSLLASCAAVTQLPCSNEATGNLYELLPLMPWMRPASPLGDRGTELYRTLDGTLMPTAAHSSAQDFWLETLTSPMGGGKSAQANRKHFDFIFAPGRKSLPFLHCLDIGGSVAGMVNLVLDALPEDQKHKAFMHTLQNNSDNAVNMLDPKLGLRYPLDADLQATVEFLTALATPAERSSPPDNMSEFCKAVLLATYRFYDDNNDAGSPHRYTKGLYDPEALIIDQALADANIDMPDNTPWYKVSDALAAKQLYRPALLAHRRAVPTLPDLIALSKDNNIRLDFMKAMTEQGLPIPDAFDTQMNLAATSYPMFMGTTKLDLRGRRVTAFDLGQVARKGSPSARKQANLMYMVAYELFAKNIRLVDEDMPLIPPVWRPYYRDELEELKNTDKHVTIDEYHRTMISEASTDDIAAHDSSGIRATLVREGGLESRKWQLSVTTISQLASHHGQLFKLASANHIIKRGSNEETAYQSAHMNLSPTDRRSLELFVNGPIPGVGVTFLTQWLTKKGSFNQLFTSTIGPKFMWSLSSTFEDKTIRQIVFDAVGRRSGRSVLAHFYPNGSAKAEVERRKLDVGSSDSDEAALEGASRLVAQELIKHYRNNPANYQ